MVPGRSTRRAIRATAVHPHLSLFAGCSASEPGLTGSARCQCQEILRCTGGVVYLSAKVSRECETKEPTRGSQAPTSNWTYQEQIPSTPRGAISKPAICFGTASNLVAGAESTDFPILVLLLLTLPFLLFCRLICMTFEAIHFVIVSQAIQMWCQMCHSILLDLRYAQSISTEAAL